MGGGLEPYEPGTEKRSRSASVFAHRSRRSSSGGDSGIRGLLVSGKIPGEEGRRPKTVQGRYGSYRGGHQRKPGSHYDTESGKHEDTDRAAGADRGPDKTEAQTQTPVQTETQPQTQAPVQTETQPQTQAPVQTETQAPQQTASGGSYILAESSQRALTDGDVAGMSYDDMQMAINEIYARHGRRFGSSSIQSYFESQSWYQGTVEPEQFDESVFSYTEQQNIQFLLQKMGVQQ